jgi:hypothetical protein
VSADKPVVVVEVRGPSRSGVTTLTRLLTQLLRHHLVRERVVGPLLVARSANDCIETLFDLGSTVEVREAEPDDRDRELTGLRMERDRLKQDVGRLERSLAAALDQVTKLRRRQIPESWTTVDRGVKTEWSGLSGDGIVDVRGSKADIDVVQSWRNAKDRLTWFEEEYKKSQARLAVLSEEVSHLEHEVTRLAGELACVDHLQGRYDRLLVAFHDATRRPLGVTPDSGEEFYDQHMADDAEGRRTRYGRGPK